MTETTINKISNALTLNWLTGPIFAKELRVSSRRRRNFVLRSVYLALLTLIMILVWMEAVNINRGDSVAYRISKMSEAGKAITATITWFQFIGLQLVALIMLSSSINEELYNRTLSVLMTTPINSLQIVMGKLFSKLLQLLILLAISLPLLAIVRVFGGVQWNYLISSLCTTITATLFAGSLSLFYSIYCKKSYIVILLSIMTMAFLYALLPFLIVLTFQDYLFTKSPIHWLFLPNPFMSLGLNTEQMFNPGNSVFRSTNFTLNVFSVIHSLIMLAMTSGVILLSIFKVRKVALKHACGEVTVSSQKTSNQKSKKSSNAAIRRVKGMPVLWKELRKPILQHSIAAYIVAALGIGILAFTYILLAHEYELDDRDTHTVFCIIFSIIGLLYTIMVSAASITAEKESRALPVLLATPLHSGQIILGKAIGSIRRCLPAWSLLAFHVILFTCIGYIHPITIVLLFIVSSGATIFLTGTGVYFSTLFKRSTTAVVVNLALALTLWAAIPFLLFISCQIAHKSDDTAEAYITANPIVQVIVVTQERSHLHNQRRTRYNYDSQQKEPLRYNWPAFKTINLTETIITLQIFWIIHVAIGFFFAHLAQRRLRRRIF